MQSTPTHEVNRPAEMLRSASKPEVPQPRSWIWLAAAAVLMLFANGADTIALAAWLAPVFMLRFLRTQKSLPGLGVAYVLLSSVFAFQFRGMVPIPGLGYYIFLLVNGVVLVFPFLMDRLLAPRIGGLTGTFVFPCVLVTTEFLSSLGPFGSWGATAYSQFGSSALLQILSVTGLWGVGFLIAWFAAVCNLIWEQQPESRQAQRAAFYCGAALVSVILLGGLRIAVFRPSGQTVRLASISRERVQPEASDTAWQHVLQNTATSAEIEEVRASCTAANDDLLDRAEREARAGAKIVFWGEGNGRVFKEDEAALVGRGTDLAKKYQIYLGMGLAAWNRGLEKPLENKIVLIQPTGQVAWEYLKARPVPGGEAAVSQTRDGKLRVLETPYGRLSAVICFDADFPRLLAQAGALHADILLDPSNDWRAIDPWHTQMASFRAIEQGVNLVRHTSGGLSAAYDYQGRRLAAMDHYAAADHSLVAQVPVRGVRTVYARLGDWFAWACVGGLVALAGKGLRRRREKSAAV